MDVVRRPLAAEVAVRGDGRARRVCPLEQDRPFHSVALHNFRHGGDERGARRDADELDRAQPVGQQFEAGPAVRARHLLVVDRAEMLEREHGGDLALFVFGVELRRDHARAAVAFGGVDDALVEVRCRKHEFDVARPARAR